MSKSQCLFNLGRLEDSITDLKTAEPLGKITMTEITLRGRILK